MTIQRNGLPLTNSRLKGVAAAAILALSVVAMYRLDRSRVEEPGSPGEAPLAVPIAGAPAGPSFSGAATEEGELSLAGPTRESIEVGGGGAAAARGASAAVDGGFHRPRYSVSGRIVTDEGEPAVDVEVSLHLNLCAKDEEERLALMRRFGLDSTSPRRRTESDGSFRFDSLPPVLYSMYVDQPVSDALPSSVQLIADEVWSLALKHRLQISGRVTGLGEQRAEIFVVPVHRALEEFFGSGDFGDFGASSPETLTKGDGSYVVRGLQPGIYTVLAVGNGLGHAHRRVEVTTALTGVDLELTEGLTLAGKFVADFPVDGEGRWLSISPNPLPHDLFDRQIEADGSFRLENLPPGSYELTVGFQPLERGADEIQRTFLVELERSVTDFQRTISLHAKRVSLRVEGPEGSHFLDGVLTAKGRNGFQSSMVRVRLDREKESHGVWRWHKRVFNPSASYRYTSAFHLDLAPGAWDIQLDLSGFETWSTRMLVSDATALDAFLTPRRGRVVLVEVESKDVAVEARRLPDGAWFTLHERDYSYRPVLVTAPVTSWLPDGIYDLRVSTRSTVEHLIEGVEVAASHEPLVITSPEEEGLRVSGRLISNAKSSAEVDLYLFVRDGEGWRLLPRKTSRFGSAYPRAGANFYFRGLAPGRYRASVDRAGEQVVARWTLTRSDLLDQVVHYEFR